ncbi:EcsC family protein [Aeromonas sp. s12]|uniref:EcsC family protein n=1 Tax=Aeromonas sp. s12 TaxID=3138482 RepID=UPI0034A1FD18
MRETNKLFAAVSGAVGGAFGFTALAIELPISTTIMLRSVADIARSEGFDLEKVETKQACLEVFALGGPSEGDDAVETAYYATRSFTAEAMQILSKELAEIAARQASANAFKKLTPAQTGKWLASLIEKIAARFGVVITEKAAAQAVPIIGAVAGATLNAMFTDYYQDMARGHFIIKRLENKYGFELVKAEYTRVSSLAMA